MPYIGNTAADRFVASKAATQFSGDGSTTAFTLEHSVGADEDILVSVDGVVQEPSVAYAVSNGTTLTFTAAPSSNSGNNIFVYYLFRTVATVDHPATSALSATTGTFSGAVTANAGVVVDNITIDGTEIDLSSGDFTLDVAGNINLDADGGSILLKDGGTQFGLIAKSSDGLGLFASVADKDIFFKGTDGSTAITALTLDMSDAGTAIFNHDIKLGSGNEISITGDGGNSGLLLRGNDSAASIVGTHGSQPLAIRTNSAERLRVDSSGNVIIGETSQINGGNLNLATSASDAVLSFLCRSTTDSHHPKIIMQKSSTNSGNFASTADGELLGSIIFRGVNTSSVSDIGAQIIAVQNGTSGSTVPTDLVFNTTETERMRITSSGQLVFPIADTTSDGANLNVRTSDGLFRRSTSSRRFKNTINDATHGLTELLQLRSVTFKGNNDGDTVFGGLIAEEVHDVGLTEFVQYNTDNQPDALAYGNMVSLCIKAIQEQQATIEALTARIVTLENA